MNKIEELEKISNEMREIISDYQKKNSLSFIEDTHTYFIKDLNGEITKNLPSVSKVLNVFVTPFNAEETWSFKNCDGDKEKEETLLKEWSDSGVYAAHQGSRVHYILEQLLIDQNGSYKQVRQPIFECDEDQISNGDSMIIAGGDFLKLMYDRKAVLLDTEMVLGSAELGYTGQPDKVWVMFNKNGEIGIVITDWKTNKPKNFLVHSYTGRMKEPFTNYWDNSLSHYYVQISLYAKLLIKMFEGTKYENVKFFGGVVVLLKKEGVFEEYRIPRDVVNKVFDMDMKKYLK